MYNLNNTRICTQPKHAIPETTIHTSESTSPANNANFKGHQLQLTQSSRRVETALQGQCAVCLETFTNAEIKQLSLLPCFHVYHSECATKALNEQAKCPECKAFASPSTLKVYDDSTSLRESLPLECTENLCTVVGTKASISSGTKAACPYPFANFPRQDTAEDFLKNNHDEILDWLEQSFAQKHYTTANARYDEKYCITNEFLQLEPQPTINISVQFNPNEPPIDLFYSSEFVNKAETAAAAFTNLLEDLRTDLLFLNLTDKYPAIFDYTTDLFIYHQDLWTYNAIFINGRDNSVPLRTIFDPSTKSFSWDRLKQALKNKDLEYKKLFETTPSEKFFEGHQYSRMRSFQDLQVDSIGGFHFNSPMATVDANCITPSSQRPVSESTLEIPSGEYDTDSFLF